MTANSAKMLRDVYSSLKDTAVKKLYIVGEKGVGKTWIAKKSTDLAVKKGIFDFALWVFLCRKYDSKSLSESFVRQLSLLSCTEESEIDDESSEAKEKKEKEETENIDDKIRDILKDKQVLLVLDDEGSIMAEAEIMSLIESSLKITPSKFLIIQTHHNNDDDTRDEEVIELEPLSTEESLDLLKEKIGDSLLKVPGLEQLAEAFVAKCRNVHSEVIALAKALSYLMKDESNKKILEDALVEARETEHYNVRRLLYSGYEPVPVSVLVDCCWSGAHFFRDSGSVHYNELITYWILEGYLGKFDSIEKCYEKGHHVLMELIDFQLLKKLESGYVNGPVELTAEDSTDRRGFGGTARLGLATVFDTTWKGLGRITQKNGLIKTHNLSTLLLDFNHHGSEALLDNPQTQKVVEYLTLFNPTFKSLPPSLSKMSHLCVLVLRGCHFLEDISVSLDLKQLTALEISNASSLKNIPNDFFASMAKLKTLNLSQLNSITSLPSSLCDLSELCRLVVKECTQLEKLQSLIKLTDLVVLDISGNTSLKTIFDKTFSKNPKLQTVNLSKTKIRALPVLNSLVDLTHLSVSECTNIERLRSVTALKNLKVLDISGAKKFKEFHNPSLENLTSISTLDFSDTELDFLPCNLANPQYLYLRGCLKLEKLPRVDGLKDLKLLDLSGSTELNEIAVNFFQEFTCLEELNLSKTKLTELPTLSNLCKLRRLLLSECGSLVMLPELSSLEKLEVLDASKCSNLTEIQDDSFQNMFVLEKLDLSSTKIEILPPLSNPSNLCRLILKKCTDLKKLPLLKSLSKLEELILSGVELKEGADFVKDMSSLEILDLSDTDIPHLPPMSNLKNLRNLFLDGCKRLHNVPNLEELTNIEVLDLSGTGVTHLPNLKRLSKLRELRLRGCSSLEKFQDLNVSYLLKCKISEIPYGISGLKHLKVLDPPNTKSLKEADTEKSKIAQQETNQTPWIISDWQAEELADDAKFRMSVSATQFLEFLKENPLSRSFEKFHFLVHPTEAHDISGYMYAYRDELSVRDVYFSKLAHISERERSLEIRGFSSFPKGVENVLRHAEFVFVIDSSFIASLSDLGSDNFKKMKSLWVERCKKLATIVSIEDPAEFGDSLEIMHISNAVSLKNIYSGNSQIDIFKNLKCFYLDCCPELSNVFPSSQRLENLEVIQINFCDKLETIFEDESAKLPKLRTLHLWALPSLTRVGCSVPALQSLRISECPKLVNVLSPAQPPENLEILHVKFCDQLESVIENSESTSQMLTKLTELHLWQLPEAKNIGAELAKLPEDCKIRKCPKVSIGAQFATSITVES
jgi:Leucine-rich repeat (LRR) protein